MMKKLIIIFLFLGYFTGYSQEITIGLIADCQFCNCDYSQKWNNDYHSGLKRLQESVTEFNFQKVDLSFHLGDFIDRDFKSFDEVSPIFNQLKMPHYHVLGNHDFSVSDSLKNKVPSALGLEQTYYSITKNNWLFIVLDGTDISLYNTDDSTQIKSSEFIRLKYLNMGRVQALPWNGAIGNTQINWLENQLLLADNEGKNVIVFCHFPILPEGDANLWNDVELINVLESHSSVKAFINGHHHPGNYTFRNNIHYLTLQGMVRTRDKNAFAIITLLKNEIKVTGYGREPNRILKF